MDRKAEPLDEGSDGILDDVALHHHLSEPGVVGTQLPEVPSLAQRGEQLPVGAATALDGLGLNQSVQDQEKANAQHDRRDGAVAQQNVVDFLLKLVDVEKMHVHHSVDPLHAEVEVGLLRQRLDIHDGVDHHLPGVGRRVARLRGAPVVAKKREGVVPVVHLLAQQAELPRQLVEDAAIALDLQRSHAVAAAGRSFDELVNLGVGGVQFEPRVVAQLDDFLPLGVRERLVLEALLDARNGAVYVALRFRQVGELRRLRCGSGVATRASVEALEAFQVPIGGLLRVKISHCALQPVCRIPPAAR
ncbi:autotransporter outer membrane beta-barrel domain-containing protein [Babesia caballi]|uniref:Autotransporter outer membrane beta-barrel domain-containing protein n=1 Tax=Babesia caballi TaxID=5871 RepID=A0AAV4LMW8_BABCB|nr:autotransporter outer membrane beta-barrel domain-containing protein [Babesia caballi]